MNLLIPEPVTANTSDRFSAGSFDSQLTPVAPQPRSLFCKRCLSCITSQGLLVSSAFRGYIGKAALFSDACNVSLAPPLIQLMVTGVHTLQELTCSACNARIGWKIVLAHDWSEKWKEGRFLLELEQLCEEERLDNSWPPISVVPRTERRPPVYYEPLSDSWDFTAVSSLFYLDVD